MTNVEALKNLYVALGGSAEDVANLDSNAAIINILGNVAGGGGGANALIINENRDTLAVGRPAVVFSTFEGSSGVSLITSALHDVSDAAHPYRIEAGSTTYYANAETGYPVLMT